MTSSEVFLELLKGAQTELDAGCAALDPVPPSAVPEGAAEVLAEAARRMHDNYPYAHPLYAGQMLKPPHPVARAAYAMAMAVNPNNHALDGGRASSAMEIEAVAEIALMFGFQQHLGHLTSSGTFANLEALWVAGQLQRHENGKPKAVAASSQAHYTHSRITGVLGLPFRSITVDGRNRLSIPDLEQALNGGDIGSVVVTLGTTATGAVDPLDEVLALRERHRFRVHVDAAYGGYFTLAGNLEAEARRAYDAISGADSIVVDPHKHGLQPYGCGCVLFADPAVGRLYKHDSPYTYFTSGELHLGEISLECSRAGAAAVALWSTQRLLPLVHGGEMAQGLDRCRKAALELYRLLGESDRFVLPVAPPQLDIVVWACRAESVEASSAEAQRVFDRAAERGLHLALAKLPVTLFPAGTWAAGESVTCLRSVLMKWEHLDWVERIAASIESGEADSFGVGNEEGLAESGFGREAVGLAEAHASRETKTQ
jgi:glutamate/tyrosine decarboxylase-like PLP-dependent enzyme